MSDLRKETLNRLHNCDCHTPAPPFPSHVIPVSLFEEMMYKVVYTAGYSGTKEDFLKKLIIVLEESKQNIDFIVQEESINSFPQIGSTETVYIDTTNNEIYYWNKDKYFKIQTKSDSELDEPIIPSHGLIYDGGVI